MATAEQVVSTPAAEVSEIVTDTGDGRLRPALAVVATPELALFESLATAMKGALSLTASSCEAMDLALLPAVRNIVVDVNPLPDQCTAQRLIRHLRAMDDGRRLKLWLMAVRRTPELQQWAHRLGAADVVSRKPRSIAALVDPQFARQGSLLALEPVLDKLDRAFAAEAGPLAHVHLQTVRGDLAAGVLAPLADAYAVALAQRLLLPQRHAAFVASARTILLGVSS